MALRADFDVAGVVAGLFVYPIKSCAGIAVQEAVLTETGLAFDRTCMVVDEKGDFLTQRALPRMVLIQPELRDEAMVLHAPGMSSLTVNWDAADIAVQAKVWKDTVAAWDLGPAVAQWLSTFLEVPCRLVRFDPRQRRLSSLDWTGGQEAVNQFADGFPLLLASEASLDGLNERLLAQGQSAVGMDRFRPNIVLAGVEAHDEDRVESVHIETGDGMVQLRPVKPCSRCPIPDIDPTTALSQPTVSAALRRYRQDPRVGGAITFGMNAIMDAGVGHTLRVGQAVGADLRFD
jgi:uncharacterized protein YcbX